MKIDALTKAVLAAIAVLLAAIAIEPYAGPNNRTVHAQGQFTGMQFAVTPVGYSFFDTRTGEGWEYSGTALSTKYRLSKPGQPLVKE